MSLWKMWKMKLQIDVWKLLKRMERPIGIEPTPEPWQGSIQLSKTLERRHLKNSGY
jgi:hypothetical protein